MYLGCVREGGDGLGTVEALYSEVQVEKFEDVEEEWGIAVALYRGKAKPGSCTGTLPPADRMTHTLVIENITFPQLRWRAVVISVYISLKRENHLHHLTYNWRKICATTLQTTTFMKTWIKLFNLQDITLISNGVFPKWFH